METQRVALPAGDYADARGEEMIATVERKTFENLVASLSDGTLAFQMQRLGEVARAAVVVEGRSLPRDHRGLRRLTEVRRRVDLPVPSGCSFGCHER